MAGKSSRAKLASRLINRELSWLEFNHRVLEEARDLSVPLLDRLKFLAITCSNLDEFFMVRVGGLQLLRAQGRSPRDATGWTPSRQLTEISRLTRRMVLEQYACFMEELDPALHQARIRRMRMADLDAGQQQYLEQVFDELIYPVITPQAIDPDQPFPLWAPLTIHLAVSLGAGGETEAANPRRAVIPMPRSLARFMTVPSKDGHAYVHLEDLITAFLDRLFPGQPVEEVALFRLTRNADMRVREDEAPDLLVGMEDILEERRTGPCVRLEIEKKASAALIDYLHESLSVEPSFLFRIPGPMDLSAYMGLATMSGFDDYKAKPWPPQCARELRAPASMFDVLSRRDVLLHHPYDSFEPVVRLLEEAANDPGVLAIKQILYRTSARSPIVAALIRAAEKGKQVTVLVELKARFDEARNIEWARALESAGVHVIYGVRGFKTHAKLCVIIRREPSGIRRYMHFGTGNYNESTARLYTDISYMTSNEDYGADAVTFFNTITGYGQAITFQKVEMAPTGLRARLLECIEGETERSLQGQKGHIMAKVNSLVDTDLIEALYRASRAGVKVELNIRGICCLRAGVRGLSENISVVSIVDRFLEHSRVMYFRHGGDPLYFISSADWMPRNLDRRIELLVPVEDPESQARLHTMLKTCLKDNVKGRELRADNAYHRRSARSRARSTRAQDYFYRETRRLIDEQEDEHRRTFIPHLPQESGHGV